MEIEIVGNVNTEDFENKVVDKLDEVLTATAERLQEEHGVNITGAVMTKAVFSLGYVIEGMDEPQVLTVEHHEGVPEMFKWIIDVDEETEVSNEDHSAYDAWTIAQAKGEELAFEMVESLYDMEDLRPIDQDVYGSMSRTSWEHIDGFRVVQVKQNGLLVQEYKLLLKEDLGSADYVVDSKHG